MGSFRNTSKKPDWQAVFLQRRANRVSRKLLFYRFVAPKMGHNFNMLGNWKSNPFLRASRMTLAGIVIGVRLLANQASSASDSAPSEQVESRFPYFIDFVSFSPQSSQFPPGDEINITSVRGNRKHFEPNGVYLIEGDYTMYSMGSAILGLYSPRSGRAPLEFNDIREVKRGTGHFRLVTSLVMAGPFPIFFSPEADGQPHGKVYIAEVASPPLENSNNKNGDSTIIIGVNNDGWISVNNRFVKGDELEPLLTEAHRRESEAAVLIESYNLVTMDMIKFVMDVCRSVGITRFGLECMTVIDFDRDGTISFNRRKITDVQLEPLLSQVRNVDANAQVLIQFYEETPLKKLAFTMDACRTAGLPHFIAQQR